MRTKTRFRRLDGILLFDKPSGTSSNQALQRVRHLLRAEKAGHTGSLDPLATGLLPICLGEATKIAGLLLGSRKAYETVAVLGTTTDTDDADGAVLRERAVPDLSDEAIDAALQPLRGAIRQRAPIYSALKQGGERLYAIARKGLPVHAPERDVEVFDLRVVERMPGALRLHVECGSGTYVRSLVRDLGELLGCGAHVAELRRLWVEPFRWPAMVTLEAMQERSDDPASLDACLLPIEAGLAQFTRIELPADEARRFGHGQMIGSLDAHPSSAITMAGSSAANHGGQGLVVVAKAGGRLLGLATLTDGTLRPQRLFRTDAPTA